nr:hypothetical protein CFP56_28695 [Quercus suber]
MLQAGYVVKPVGWRWRLDDRGVVLGSGGFAAALLDAVRADWAAIQNADEGHNVPQAVDTTTAVERVSSLGRSSGWVPVNCSSVCIKSFRVNHLELGLSNKMGEAIPRVRKGTERHNKCSLEGHREPIAASGGKRYTQLWDQAAPGFARVTVAAWKKYRSRPQVVLHQNSRL